MTTILHYLVLKSWRDRFLAALLLGPAVLILTPALGLAGAALLQGRILYPVAVEHMSAADTSLLMTRAAALIAALAAGAGGFWILRREVAKRSLGSFLLATHSSSVALAATLYGALSGVAAFLITLAGIAVATAEVPPHLAIILTMAVASSVFASALGAMLVMLSSEVTMLVPVYAGSAVVSLTLLDGAGLPAIGIILLAAALVMTAAAMLMRWRCTI